MDPASIILLLAFVCLLLLGVPVAIGIGVATWLAVLTIGGIPVCSTLAQRMAGGLDSFPLLAIPLFIIAGDLMGAGGLARRLIDLAQALVGKGKNALVLVNGVACMLFGAISGSAAAAVSSIGTPLIPEMQARGYQRPAAVALTATCATTGLLIPPSNIMIVYAVVAQQSIAAMFLAGVFPGILIGIALITAACLCQRKRVDTPVANVAEADTGVAINDVANPSMSLWVAIWRAVPSLFLIVLVLGGILGGIFSATEASGIAVAYAALLGVIYREIKFNDFPKLLIGSTRTTGVVLLLIATSMAMTWVLSRQQVPQAVAAGLLGLTENPLLLLLMINVILLAAGTVLDMTPAVLILTPVLLPVAIQLGIAPVHFGVVLVANLCVGLCTPPVGAVLFLGCRIGQTRIEQTAKAMVPLFIAMLAALAVITFWAPLSLWLPGLLLD